MEEIDLIKKLNEDHRSSKIDVTEEYFDEADYGKTKCVYSERIGSDYDMYQMVFYFEKYDKYFSICGSYSSYDGYDFSYATFEEVVPKEVKVIEYVKA